MKPLAALLSLPVAVFAAVACADEPRATLLLDVAPVWSAHPVNFDLLTVGNRQFVAYYDADRCMTVGMRTLDQKTWQRVRLPSMLGWDSHSALSLGVDDRGLIHLSGNMHCQPLLYFRTDQPFDISTFRQVNRMIGLNEWKCTYPHFFHGPGGALMFTYRDGNADNGDQYFNVWNSQNLTWSRLMPAPLFSGGGKVSAYFDFPKPDKAGRYHICWVWRDTFDCSTNHDLCYAQSPDLVHWQKSDGTPLTLPITQATAEIVDPVPSGGGMLNGNQKIGFDLDGRVLISYYKFDAQGRTQLYVARLEKTGWKILQTSAWDYRWDFHGIGTLRVEMYFGEIRPQADKTLTQTYWHIKYGQGTWILDPQTLKPIGVTPNRPAVPQEIAHPVSTWPGMTVRTVGDSGDTGKHYLLRWETLPPNRDLPRPAPLPPPSMLRLYEIN